MAEEDNKQDVATAAPDKKDDKAKASSAPKPAPKAADKSANAGKDGYDSLGNKLKAGHAKGYVAVHRRLHNPYTGDVYNTSGEPTKPRFECSWLMAQMDAGLIKKVG